MYDFHVVKNKINNYFSLVPFSKTLVEGRFYNIKSNYYTWFFDQEVTKYNSHGLFPQTEKEFEEFFNSLNRNNLILSIIDTDKKIHVGNVSLQSINWINLSAEFAVIIGRPDYWGYGITTAAGRVILKHGFEKLGLNRIWTGTAATNEGMKKVAEKLGMIKEGTFRDGMFLENSFVDVYSYGILRNEWNEQNREYRYNEQK